MKKTLRIFFSLFTAVSILLTPISAIVPEKPLVGMCGNDLLWSLSTDGVLTLNGEGDMYDYGSPKLVPWNKYQDAIKTVKVSESVTSIGDYAFYYCENLSSVTLPEGIVSIGDYAFYRCYSLTSLNLPDSTQSIGDFAFSESYNLKSLDPGTSLQSIGDSAFLMCSSLSSISLPRSLKVIGNSAFSSCSSLATAKLPDGLEYLGVSAFQSCLSLSSINIPWQLKSIPQHAFMDCQKLTSVTFGRYLETIAIEAFLWCNDLLEIRLPASVAAIEDHALGYYYIDGEYRKTEGFTVITPDGPGAEYASSNGFKIIHDDSTHECANKCPYCGKCKNPECDYYTCYEKCTGHTFPITGECGEDAVWSLSENGRLTVSGSGAMSDFTYDTVPWKEYASAINNVIIDEGITTIGDFAFQLCENMAYVMTGSSIEKIGYKAFYRCENMLMAEIPGFIDEIGSYAFAFCKELEFDPKTISARCIGSYAFFGCDAFTTLRISEGCEEIGAYAFVNCPLDDKIDLPLSVKKIGDRALGYILLDGRYIRSYLFTIYGEYGGAAWDYANKNDFEFIRTDRHECSSICPVCGKCTDYTCVKPECKDKCSGLCLVEWENPFGDVERDDWYYEAVKFVSLEKIFNGTANDRFSPNEPLTRAMFVTLLYRIENSPEVGNPSFDDVDLGTWYSSAVSWAAENKIVLGVGNGKFNPGGRISREDLAAIMYRYALWKGLNVSNRADISSYTDGSSVSSYAIKPVSWAVEAGIITGKPGPKLEPKSGATRAEAATILTRFLRSL